MIKLTFCAILLFAFHASAVPLKPRVIYGEDNRQDVYEVSNPLLITLSESTAGMVDHLSLKKNKKDSTYSIQDVYNLGPSLNLCSSERFTEQPLLATCSGFLVGEDILVTAAHCFFDMEVDICKTSSWVFDLKMENSNYINLSSIPKDNVYKCKEVLKTRMDDKYDYAIVKLDRKVVGRKPLEFRKTGKIKNEANLVTIGHPTMLPLKITDSGKVLSNENDAFFETSLDAFQGNSGSAVFDSETGLLEGILIGGKTDFVPSRTGDYNSCQVANVCSENGEECLGTDNLSKFAKGERVIRISEIADLINEFIK